jgi:hypothetical protein
VNEVARRLPGEDRESAVMPATEALPEWASVVIESGIVREVRYPVAEQEREGPRPFRLALSLTPASPCRRWRGPRSAEEEPGRDHPIGEGSCVESGSSGSAPIDPRLRAMKAIRW